MPWTNRGSGPTGGNGGGPWGPPPRGSQPPNLEDLLRQGQERFRSMLPGSLGGGRGVVLILLIVIAVWGASGFYRVLPDEQGVVLRFGQWVKTTLPGLHYHLPTPIESVLIPSVTTVHREEIGFRSGEGRNGTARAVPEESLMLTGDENIVDINFSVFWRIKDAGAYLFNLDRPEITVKSAAEASMREVVGNNNLQPILSEGKQAIADGARQRLQSVLDQYGAGVEVTEVNLQKADAPQPVIDAYNDVQRAKADLERQVAEAQAYLNDLVPRARGEATQMVQQAEAYKQQVLAVAQGDAQRFLSVYQAYSVAKDVTVRRMYLETMEQVLKGSNKIVLDQAGGQGVLPYLQLPNLNRPATPAPAGGR